MTQPISVVIPVYDGVTQLDFTGPHQFLSRTPDLNVRVASLEGEPVTADLTFSNLEDLTVIKSCDVLLVPGGGGCINAIENDRFIKEIVRLGATARYLTSVCTGSLILGAAGLITGRRAACQLGMARISSGLRRHRRRGPHREGWQYLVRRGRHGRHRFRVGTDRGVAWITRGRDGSTRLGICASTALRLRAPGHGASRSAGSGERTQRSGLR
jgi:putative intracellular protease/amidase